MTVKLYATTCGYLTLPRAFMLAGAKGKITVPVPSYYIEHAKGRVLFDSGLHEQTLQTPADYVGDVITKYHTFHFSQGEQISSRLEAMSVDPGSINFVINSHLHFDHCGGNGQINNADVVIQKLEIQHARSVDQSQGYVRSDWDTGQSVLEVCGEHDLFGDGSVVCLPTYGHTPGHQSLRVQTEQGGEFILCGDACYLKESLTTLTLPGIVADKQAVLAVFGRFKEMQARGATIMYGHDPDFWQTVPQAPIRLG